MKKLLILLMLFFVSNAWAVDTKLKDLANNSSPADADLIYDYASSTDYNVKLSDLKTYMSNSPTLVTPTLGVASATSINKVAITAPATSATLTIADGKTLTVNNTATINTLTGGDWCSYTASGTSIHCDNAPPLTGLTVGSTSISSGTNLYLEYNNSGTLGELAENTVGGLSFDCQALPSAVSSFTMSNGSGGCSIAGGKSYILELTLVQNTTTGQGQLVFNADSGGTNYTYEFRSNSSSGVSNNHGTAGNGFYSVNNIVATGGVTAWVLITPSYVADSINILVNSAYQANGAPTWAGDTWTERYDGSAALSSIKVQTTAGTVTGTATLYQLN